IDHRDLRNVGIAVKRFESDLAAIWAPGRIVIAQRIGSEALLSKILEVDNVDIVVAGTETGRESDFGAIRAIGRMDLIGAVEGQLPLVGTIDIHLIDI